MYLNRSRLRYTTSISPWESGVEGAGEGAGRDGQIDSGDDGLRTEDEADPVDGEGAWGRVLARGRPVPSGLLGVNAEVEVGVEGLSFFTVLRAR